MNFPEHVTLKHIIRFQRRGAVLREGKSQNSSMEVRESAADESFSVYMWIDMHADLVITNMQPATDLEQAPRW
jgi:hypothetical protein